MQVSDMSHFLKWMQVKKKKTTDAGNKPVIKICSITPAWDSLLSSKSWSYIKNIQSQLISNPKTQERDRYQSRDTCTESSKWFTSFNKREQGPESADSQVGDKRMRNRGSNLSTARALMSEDESAVGRSRRGFKGPWSRTHHCGEPPNPQPLSLAPLGAGGHSGSQSKYIFSLSKTHFPTTVKGEVGGSGEGRG